MPVTRQLNKLRQLSGLDLHDECSVYSKVDVRAVCSIGHFGPYANLVYFGGNWTFAARARAQPCLRKSCHWLPPLRMSL